MTAQQLARRLAGGARSPGLALERPRWRRLALRTGCALAAVVVLGGTPQGRGLLAMLFGLLPALAVAVPVAALSAVTAARRPAATLTLAIALMAASGSLRAFTGGAVPAERLADLLLVGLFLSAVWGFFIAGRHRAVTVWPGLALLALYLVVTLFEIPLADPVGLGFESFRTGPAYALLLFVVAYAPWPEGTRWRMARGVVGVALAVGAYAALRLAIGPAEAERELALSGPTGRYSLVNEELTLLGSFSARTELGGWVAVVLPFCFAIALTARGRWRVVAAAAAVLCAVALLGSEVRAGLVAALLGMLLAFALYEFGRASHGARLGVAAAAIACTAAVGIAGYAATVGGSEGATDRYERIFNPESDRAYQDRVLRRVNTVAELRGHPLGHGLGTAGIAHRQGARFVRIDSFSIDNSYLEVAYQQGYALMALFLAGLALVVWSLARGAVTTVDPRAAAIATGAAAALAAWMVLLTAGGYRENWSARLAWILAGLGAAELLARRRRDTRAPAA